MDEDWQSDLERWLAPYLEGLGNKTRRRMCPAYIAGLIGPGDRKSIQPMAARSDAVAYDRPQLRSPQSASEITPRARTLTLCEEKE
jgi:SRSO17 transposase